jgi:hypothetical protein
MIAAVQPIVRSVARSPNQSGCCLTIVQEENRQTFGEDALGRCAPEDGIGQGIYARVFTSTYRRRQRRRVSVPGNYKVWRWPTSLDTF